MGTPIFYRAFKAIATLLFGHFLAVTTLVITIGSITNIPKLLGIDYIKPIKTKKESFALFLSFNGS
jgi:hypothetical protein